MKRPEKQVIVMGLSVNGLGVLRSIGSLGVDCFGIYVDEREELGIHSRYLVESRKIRFPFSVAELRTELDDIARKYSLEKPLLIPTTDYFAEFICNQQDSLREFFTIRCPSFELHESFLDKAKTIELCKNHHVPIPRTETPETTERLLEISDSLEYPVIVKPRKTFGTEFPGKNYIAETKSSLMNFFYAHPSLLNRSIMQEIVPSGDGNIYVTAAYSGIDSRVTEIYVGRKLRQYPPDYGVTCFGESHPVAALESLTRRFLDGIGYSGFSALEFAFDERAARYYFIELNTRTYYHNQLFSDANVDLNRIAYYEMLGDDYRAHLPDIQQIPKLIWIDFKRDISTFYRKRKARKIKFLAWFTSIFKARSFAYLDSRDMRPFFASTMDLFRKLSGFLFGRKNHRRGSKSASNVESRVINLLFMIDWFSKRSGGGTENHLANVISRLSKAKFRSKVCVFDAQHGPITEKIENSGADILYLPVGKFYSPAALLKIFKLMKYIRKNRIDIVQTFHFKSDTYGVIAARMSGVSRIVSSRRDLGELKKRRHIILNRIINPLIDRFIMVCEAVGKACRMSERIPKRKMTTIYNGVDLNKFQVVGDDIQSKWRKEAGISEAALVLGSIAHFRPEKAYHVFFDGIEKVRNEIEDFHVLILGDGPLRKKYEEHCDEVGLSNRVSFLGAVTDVPRYIAMMDVLCLVPNRNEGFSNALLEGMAMAKPVIATDVGGNGEAIVDGETGILIPPDDPGRLAESIIRLHRNPEQRIKMGLLGRKRIEDHFDLDGMVSRMEEFYQQLIGDGNPS